MESIFSTGSTNIVAFLMSKGINPVDTSLINGQTYFLYTRSKILTDALNEYDNNKELKAFIACFKKVKELIRR